MTETMEGFGIVDYCLFGATLLVSAGIGLFYAFKDRINGATADELLRGGGDMPIIPTALSLLTSFLSGVTLLGVPPEVYSRGAAYWFSRVIGTIVGILVAMFISLPILYDFRPTSVYEYFERRFNSYALRVCGAILYLLFMMAYMGVVLYAPAVALNGITGVPSWIFFLTVGLVCNIYTSLGGLKAVVWTDTFQAVIMIGGVATIFIKGCVDCGGIKHVFETAAAYGRFDGLKKWELNPFQYSTMWTQMCGGIAFWFTLITFNQISAQRYLSLTTLKKSRTVLAITIPGYLILMFFADLTGIVMFTYFLGCDPIRSKQVAKKDQLVIYYALKVIGKYKGLPGVFLACLFSGTLSTISSGINSMAAVLWEDFFERRYGSLPEDKKSLIITIMAFSFGFLAIGLAFAAEPLGGILQVALTLMGAIGGPVVGLFILGMLFPQANRFGAIIGLGASVMLTGWIALGGILTKPYKNYALELPVDQCPSNFTQFLYFNGTAQPNWGGVSYLYTLSEVFYPALGMIIVVIIGLPSSLLLKEKDDARFDDKAATRFKTKLTVADLNCCQPCRKRNRAPNFNLGRCDVNGAANIQAETTV